MAENQNRTTTISTETRLEVDEDGHKLLPDENSVFAEPAAKKMVSRRTIRNRADRQLINDDDSLEECHVYSSRVSTVFGGLKTGQIFGAGVELNLIDDDNDDEDDHNLMTNQRSTAKGRKTSNDEEDVKPKSNRLRRKNAEKDRGSKITESEPVFEVVDDEDETESSTKRQGRDRSPTPPPELPFIYGRHRPHRTSRKVKSAIGKLEDLRHRLDHKSKRPQDQVGVIDVLDVEDLTTPSPKKVMKVKIRSELGVHRFDVQKTETFDRVFNQVAEIIDTTVDRLIFFLGDRTIQPYDTPRTLQLSVADILHCHTKKENTGPETDDLTLNDDLSDDPDILHLRVQANNAKSGMTINVLKTEPLEKLMREYARRAGADYSSLVFTFDGDRVEGHRTAADLDIEDYECLDVVNSSS